MMNYGQQQYKKTQVATVDRGRLIVLLYEGAISFLTKAKACMDAGELDEACKLVNRAQDIIDELNASLNMEAGGDISANLRKLYLFMSDQLVQAKMRRNGESIDEVVGMLGTLNDAWRQAVASPEAQQVLSQRPVPPRAQMRAGVNV